jgi:CRP-like cAMP-binding protein
MGSPAPENLLLTSLRASDRNALTRQSSMVTLRAGETLLARGQTIRYAYFPLGSAIGVLQSAPEQPDIATALIGHEGVLGFSLIFGARRASLHAIVQSGGPAWRVDARRFSARLGASAQLRTCMNRYAHARFLQAMQGGACGSFHCLESRLARWLLMSSDRTGSVELRLTHEFLARMLGARRAGVTIAANALRDRGFTSYSRGRLVLLDERGLAAAACPCYQQDKNIYARSIG